MNKIKYISLIGAPAMAPEEAADFVGAGWKDLVVKMFEDLFELGWNGELHQIKEKFGALRVYIGDGTHAMFERIHEAEKASHEICEVCGAKGSLKGKYWVKTLCDLHSEEPA